MMRRLTEQRGIAAVTVLLVTLVLSVAGTVVVFSATTGLEIEARDTRAEQAFSAAEAGLDQAAHHFGTLEATWPAGQTVDCLNNPLVDDGVEYIDTSGELCGVRLTSPSNGRFVYPPTGKPFIEFTAVSRAQEGRTATRTLVSTFRVEALEIPYGMVVNGNVDLNGTPDLLRESVLVNGTVTSREKLDLDWNANGQFDDPDLGWAFHKDLIVSDPAVDMCFDESTGQNVGCAGVYANFQIFEKNQQKISDEIHQGGSVPPASSPFPRDRDVHQGTVDGSGEPVPVVTIPTEKILEPLSQLKGGAEAQGLYFNYKDGSNNNIIIQPGDIGAPGREFEKHVVVYIDGDAGDSIGWKVNQIPGSTSSDMLYTNADGDRVGPESMIIIVRGASFQVEANTQISGAIFVPEGTLRILGGATCTCTIYAQGFTAQGGGSQIQLTPEWFGRIPPGLTSVLRTGFFECEPFQPYPSDSVCAGI